jgi:hypothetical protein
VLKIRRESKPAIDSAPSRDAAQPNYRNAAPLGSKIMPGSALKPARHQQPATISLDDADTDGFKASEDTSVSAGGRVAQEGAPSPRLRRQGDPNARSKPKNTAS